MTNPASSQPPPPPCGHSRLEPAGQCEACDELYLRRVGILPDVTDIQPVGAPQRRTVLVVKGKPEHVMAELKEFALAEGRTA